MDNESTLHMLNARRHEISAIQQFLDYTLPGMFDRHAYNRMTSIANGGIPSHESVAYIAKGDYRSFYPIFSDAASLSDCNLGEVATYLDACLKKRRQLPQTPNVSRFFRTLDDLAQIAVRVLENAEMTAERCGCDPEYIGWLQSDLYRKLSVSVQP